MSDLVNIQNDQLVIGTWALSEGFGVKHRTIKRTIDKYKTDFAEHGFIANIDTESASKKRGGQVEEYLLNEDQVCLLTMLMKNCPNFIKFKKRLSDAFKRQRKMLANLNAKKRNAEWIEKRKEGKIQRLAETDTIKKLVQRGIDEGSSPKDMQWAYADITKEVNKALFAHEWKTKEFKNFRDILNTLDLDMLRIADIVMKEAIEEGLKTTMSQSEIRKRAKEKVIQFALMVGKKPFQLMDKKERKQIEAKQNLSTQGLLSLS